MPVIAASSPSQCFHAAIEAARIALKYRTPVYLLSDAYLANGSEPWLIPDVGSLPDISTPFATGPNDGERFLPYKRDPETLARPWAVPGTPGLEHRIGGLEKEDVTGAISYDAENHDLMIRLRAQKVAEHRNRHSRARGRRPRRRRDERSCSAGARPTGRSAPPSGASARDGRKVARAHLHHLNPFPRNTGDVLRRYEKVLVPEMNHGQLLQADPGRVPRRRGRLQPRAWPAVPARPSSPTRSRPLVRGLIGGGSGNGKLVQLTSEGLQVGPGGALVPRAAATTRS